MSQAQKIDITIIVPFCDNSEERTEEEEEEEKEAEI